MIGLIEQACGREAEKVLMPMQPGDVRDTYADISAIQRDLASGRPTRSTSASRFREWYRRTRVGADHRIWVQSDQRSTLRSWRRHTSS
jgi:hypothetical protein